MSLAKQVAELCGEASKNPSPKGYYQCLCPSHTEEDPSCGIKDHPDGTIRVHCFKCPWEKVMDALESKRYYVKGKVGKSPQKTTTAKKSAKAEDRGTGPELIIQETYEYKDFDGQRRNRKTRALKSNGKKTFWWQQWDGKKYLPAKQGRNEDHLYLWRAPEIKKAAEDGQFIFITEGEEDAKVTISWGLIGTSVPDGADSEWLDIYTETLRGALMVYILPDNDAKGEELAQRIADALYAAGIPCTIIRLPGLPAKGDLRDWTTKCGHTEDEFYDIMQASTSWTPDENPLIFAPGVVEEESEPAQEDHEEKEPDSAEFLKPNYQRALQMLKVGEYPDGDIANGKRLANKFGDDARFVIEGAWFHHRSGIWNQCSKEHTEIDAMAKHVFSEMRQEVKLVEKLAPKLSQRLNGWTNKCNKQAERVSACVKMARSEEKFRCSINDFDKDKYLLNCLNGLLDLKTGVLGKHDQSKLCSKQVDLAYDPNADYTEWETFLLSILDNNWDMLAFLKRAVGYSLTGETKEQKAFFLYGPGGNGKSVFLNRIQKIMGSYGVSVRSQMFMRKRVESQMDNPAIIHGKRFVSVSEIAKSDKLDEAMFKSCTGGDPVRARPLYLNSFDFWPECKPWFVGNFLPDVNDTTEGIWRRVLVIALRQRFENPDKELADRLDANLPGILRWAVEGAIEWYLLGLEPPKEVLEETKLYRDEQDRMGNYIYERIIFDKLAPPFQASELFGDYVKWCEANTLPPGGITRFGTDIIRRKEFEKAGVKKEKSRSGVLYIGMRLRTAADPIDFEPPVLQQTLALQPN